VWTPSEQQWQDIAACGELGLIYVILSPDAELRHGPSISWITETLLTGSVLPAPGHFLKTDPPRSARALQAVFDQVAAWGKCPTITDHLFNDMPLNFRHAWRTPAEKERRTEELKSMRLERWNQYNVEEQLGPVPATMVRAAWNGTAKICQNFDGEHVDLAVAKRAVDLIGSENMLMMTDSIESKRLGGQNLHLREGSTLLFQEKGIVAAGSQCVKSQVANMLSVGLDPRDIRMMTNTVPRALVSQRDRLGTNIQRIDSLKPAVGHLVSSLA
jgi:hypothetical protein